MTHVVVLADTHIRRSGSHSAQGAARALGRLPDAAYAHLEQADVILHAGDILLNERRAVNRAPVAEGDAARTERFEAEIHDSSHAKPVATMSDPTLLFGRRSQANRPAPMSKIPPVRSRRGPKRSCQWLLKAQTAASAPSISTRGC